MERIWPRFERPGSSPTPHLAHDRTRFSSGSAPLDRYLRERASQDIKRRIATCFVAVDTETQDVVGFYTLTAISVALNALSPELMRKLPRYPVVPAALLGRLAVTLSARGKGLGAALLADTLLRVARVEAGIYAMLVDAKEDAAQRLVYDRQRGLIVDRANVKVRHLLGWE